MYRSKFQETDEALFRGVPNFSAALGEFVKIISQRDSLKGELKCKIIFSRKVLKDRTNSKMVFNVFKCF